MPSKKVMEKWKSGDLHSGSKKGPKVKGRAQAVAIMLSEKRKEKAHGGKYPDAKAKPANEKKPKKKAKKKLPKGLHDPY